MSEAMGLDLGRNLGSSLVGLSPAIPAVPIYGRKSRRVAHDYPVGKVKYGTASFDN